MTNYNDRILANMTIEGNTFKIVASIHAEERMSERNINAHVVAGSVLALGPERIVEFQDAREEAIIIDKENNASVVVGFEPGVITVITVIDKSNVFVKDNTTICNI